MPEFITNSTRIPVPGGKVIEEFVGRVNSGHDALSIAHMKAPSGWTEPFQTPQFDEYTVVLSGSIIVDSEEGRFEVDAGQAVRTRAGERIRYSCGSDGAEYIAVCLPAFSPETVNREESE